MRRVLDRSPRRLGALACTGLALVLLPACFQDPGRTGLTASESSSSTTDETNTTNTTETTGDVCGDGVVDDGEQCDNGTENNDNAECTAGCMNNVCGDGLVQTGVEACDDVVDSLDCNSDCTQAACGDGYVNGAAGEECEADIENGTCNESCRAICNGGFASCDTVLGCETAVWTDPETCGGCDLSCAGGAVCNIGVCDGKRVFVTDAVYSISDFAGGLATMHGICQSEAVAAGITGATFRAWVASNVPPNGLDDFTPSTTPYVRMDGMVIANDFGDLTDGTLAVPINLNAAGGVPGVPGTLCQGGTATCPFVYSGITPGGTAGGGNCTFWTDDVASQLTPGDMTKTDGTWTAVGLSLACGAPARLYCFEQ